MVYGKRMTMSMLPNSAQFMAQALRNGTQEKDIFHKFFERWLVEQNNYLEELVNASNDNRTAETSEEHDEERVLVPLIEHVIKHYEQYYIIKSSWAAEHDVSSMLNPSWRSSFEDAFLWIGGWRPTMAFHLLYSKSGLQLEAGLAQLLQGLRTGDLGDLSPDQLRKVDELQRRTVREEREISEKFAKKQATIADTSMVELSHVVSEFMRQNRAGQEGGDGIEDNRVESTLAIKEDSLVEILQMADDLRLKTLKEVLKIFTPIQSVHFLIAAAELHLRLHDWGTRRDAVQQRGGGDGNQ